MMRSQIYSFLEVDPGSLRDKMKELVDAGARFSTSVAVDERPINSCFSHTYILFLKDRGYVLLTTKLSSEMPEHDTLTDIVPGVEWAEKEAMELVGIKIRGLPQKRKLILPENWPEDLHPLRKDFDYRYRPVEKADLEAEGLPIGPYHPALHEPESFRLYVRGEEIIDAEYVGFLVHRGVEKVAEGRLTYNQIPFIAERICGICGFIHSTLYCNAVERAAGIDVPERAKWIRSFMLELERIHSHLLLVGVVCHMAGFDTGFMHAWRLRENFMRLAERISGNRKTYGMNLVGGVRRDIDNIAALDFLKSSKKDIEEYVSMLMENRLLIRRCEGIGVLGRQDARKMCVVGPVARASGIDIDVRRDSPYEAYGELSFRVPVYMEGDVLSRVMVRLEEIKESISILEQIAGEMPKGPIMAETRDVPPLIRSIAAGEAPRGEDIHFVITGRDNKVYRWRVRSPTYNNLPALPLMLKGNLIADAPLIIGSIDPCFSCTDRCIVLKEGRRYRLEELVGRGRL
ncbi:MAG: hydrogenase large subunit [Thermoproteota archaeon]|jgi:Ni,Fe-hydrogenase III large subunit/Ni,Fe-hydrogenase III component G|uniref:Hydrogenase large subunit n=2 Tax=Candidatus Methanodesulfokora washburnensis TaxID=2478471 RepID=A0A429GPE4_9CREN|nr:hydrogenase large subunit [Candidatus Methanodesulfokores washburnensis]RZN62117.1 MAG: hydrogenase large subunit [Candidatus Methanodesulfokores washburnensis]TDA41722.1 MAG: hydrogenase large subunit [Candidatus Korarchaeota archaeon]